MTMQSYSDDHLRDYLGGRLSQSENQAIEADLELSPELEQRLLALEPFAADVRTAFEQVPDISRISELMPPAPSKQKVRPFLGLALAASLAGVLGFGLGNFTTDEPTLGWRDQIAVYQALYVPETIAALDPTDAELYRQFALGSQKLGVDLAPETFRDLDNLSLKRAQILKAEEHAMVQIVLAGSNGQPMAFCIVNVGSDAQNTQPVHESIAGIPTVHWVEDGYGFMLVGRFDDEVLDNTTKALQARTETL